VIEDGGAMLTWIVTTAVALPPVLVAVIVYVVDEVIAVGVPLIAPVELSNDSPDGSDGETDQDVTVPPLDVGVAVVIVVPLVNVNEFGV
tara:strand:+ start:154 stop:420 length:267 start_codon:yes stop_codon:yes gene_type:complete